MKRVLLAMLALLLIPGMAMGAATLGVYINGKLSYSPALGSPFEAYLYIVTNDYDVAGIQYMLDYDISKLGLLNTEFPFYYSVDIGDPLSGHAVTYSPPVSTYPNGYAWLVKYEFVTLVDCPDMFDFPISVVGHPDPGLQHPVYGGLYGIYPPNMVEFDVDGLTTVLCPFETDTEEESWGAIKSMYK
jgi:hypothetical protein